MSLFQPHTLTCPSCAALTPVEAVNTVNADRRPDLKQAIADGTFQVFPCSACEAPIRLEPLFNYLEVGAGLWLAAYPARQMPDYLEVEDDVSAVFDETYGDGAPPVARGIGDGLRVRLTFGWPAAREKLLLRANDIDDTLAELLKLDVLRRLPEAPLEPGIELRVTDVSEDKITMRWVDSESEEVIDEFGVARALLDEIALSPEGWAPVRAQLENGPFVDMQKLYMGQGRAAAE
ncbi:MAG: hypothetical protein CML02_22840 [Pseudooceanicola sp.]|jgi:hypothetical protein|nr:hypothetical protein [Pseudooceanicola sp.]